MGSKRDCADRWMDELSALPPQRRFKLAHHAKTCQPCKLRLLIFLDNAERSHDPEAQALKAAAVIAGVDTKRMSDLLFAMYTSEDSTATSDGLDELPASELDGAYRRYMSDVRDRCRALSDAIGWRDFENVEYTASRAVHAWLDGRSTFQRLLAHTQESDPARSPDHRLLETSCARIARLLSLASSRIAARSTRQALQRLRAMLSAANRELLAQL
jgi:hypothetical protein